MSPRPGFNAHQPRISYEPWPAYCTSQPQRVHLKNGYNVNLTDPAGAYTTSYNGHPRL